MAHVVSICFYYIYIYIMLLYVHIGPFAIGLVSPSCQVVTYSPKNGSTVVSEPSAKVSTPPVVTPPAVAPPPAPAPAAAVAFPPAADT